MDFLTVNGHTLHYQHLKTNPARTFVFANSLGTDFRIWDEVVALLSPHGSILRFDKPGHGLSKNPDNALSIPDYVADVVGLLDTLHIQTCIFVGLSIGGVIGQQFALIHPERIEKLVLSNTAPQIGTAESWNIRIQSVEEQGMTSITTQVLSRWFPAAYQEAVPDRLAGYRRMIEQTSITGYVRACEAIRDVDLTTQIRLIQLPTLCIGGTDDLSTPADQVRAMAADIPRAQVAIIDGAGHIPCAQMPDRVAKLILDFVHADSYPGNEPGAGSEKTLYETGMKTRRAVLGDAHVDRSEASKTDLDIDFQRYITESAWGMVWSRPGLTLRERSLITIALLTALGHKDELAMHIRATRNTGATPGDVKETLLQTTVYAGAPATLGALKIVKAIFAETDNQP